MDLLLSMSSTLNCLPRRGVEGVGRVIQHATGASDLDRVFVAGAGRTVLGSARDLYVAHQHHGVVE